ncbi:putative nuclease YhcG [Methanimicrococcus sp. At1]|uniref:Nuclease YhcG n=1 Tax=Methanimicrococcus hacksteinii TaxID=3028293 RepID=A0ABU3VP75_9EURY|nr:PDDEXK nuclease domain-containing protein [Methanimicrococcus sp. At1]MDV0445201.1 putative nuclease YhcG [Methanimicrococcus sp. At1]
MILEKEQTHFIAEIKQKVRKAQYEALKSVNTQLIDLYWEIGKAVSEKQSENWGKSVVPTLSKELQKEFPGVGGFSEGNLWLMAQFYSEYHGSEVLVPLVRDIGWSKHVIILKKCKDEKKRQFYILAAKKFGWTKNVLAHQIENQVYEKYLISQTNFSQILPDEIKNQAYLAVKDEYTFDFLELAEEHNEKQLEQSLVGNIRNFLQEMGHAFTFVGEQYRIEVGGKEFFIDLLLFHRHLKCLVAVELKIGEFLPEYKGKMEFYLAVLNDTVKLPEENDSIGIIICREKNRTVVEYSLKTGNAPIGVATYTTDNHLPENYETYLPTIQEIDEKLLGLISSSE